VLFWESEDEQEKELRGGIALLADGVGGHGDGEIASRLAVTTALNIFRSAEAATTTNQMLRRLFNEANLAVYDAGMHGAKPTRMATTLTVALFRRNEVAIGHVGDSRAYLVRQGQIRQLTSDHTYVAMQVKMSLISKEEAMSSDLRAMLTRSIGENPTVQVDYNRAVLRDYDTVIQCTDGLHACLTEHELRDCVNRMPPSAACEHLVRIAEKRGSQDNISVQVVRVENVPRVGYYRGAVAYSAPSADVAPLTQELQPGSLLDERFQITDVISRSAMSSVFNSASTLVTLDFYKKIKPDASEHQLVTFGRAATGILVVLGMLWVPFINLINAQLFIYLQAVQAYVSPPIAVCFIFGILWPRMNAKGAITSLMTGFVLGSVRFTLEVLDKSHHFSAAPVRGLLDINFLHYAILMFGICTLALIAVSLMTPAPERSKLAGLTFATVQDKVDLSQVRGQAILDYKPAPEKPYQHRLNLIFSAILVATVVSLWIYFR